MKISIFNDREVTDFLEDAVHQTQPGAKVAFSVADLGQELSAGWDRAKTEAQNGYGQIDQSLGGYGRTLIGGLAGAAAGGAGLYATSGRREDESEADFQKRRRQNALTGAIGGAALGGAIPTLANALGHGPERSGAGAAAGRMLGRAGEYVNPFHNRVTGAAAGAGTGALAGTGVMSAADRAAGVNGDKLPAAIELMEKRVDPGSFAQIRQSGTMTGPMSANEERLARMVALQKKLEGAGPLARVNPFGDIAREERALQVGRGGPMSQLVRGALTAGGLAYGAMHAGDQ